MAVAYRQPTFKNPLPSFFKRVFVSMINACERAGRARAASELAKMGRYEDAKRVMLEEYRDRSN
jgi:hypothetical protein